MYKPDPEVCTKLLNILILGTFDIGLVNLTCFSGRRRTATATIIVRVLCCDVAATALVSILVFRKMLDFMNDKVQLYDWFSGRFEFGFSFGFACVTFILLILSGSAFFMVSSKRKREKALSAREAVENEPVQLGR